MQNIVFSYLQPWDGCIYSSVCKSLRRSYLENRQVIDSSFLKRTKTRFLYDCCFFNGRLLPIYDPVFTVEHTCTTSSFCNGVNGDCRRNNAKNPFLFWNVRELQPFKCSFCGTLFVTNKIAQKVFFLSYCDTRCLDIYKFQNKKLFQLKHVLFVSKHVNGTLTPFFKRSKERQKREKWLNCRVLELRNSEHVFFDVDSLLITSPFQNFLRCPQKLFHLHFLFEKLYTVIPYFFEETKRLQTLIVNVFPDMSLFINKNVHDEDFMKAFRRSIEFGIGISLRDDLEKGLCFLRETAFDVHRKFIKDLERCQCENTDEYNYYQSFKEGLITITELIYLVERQIHYERNRKVLFEYLHNKGIHPESIQCDLVNSFIHNDSVTMIQVFECLLYNHILYDLGTCSFPLKCKV